MANEVKAMGSRLGVIVKTIDGWDIRYDHWSAQTLGRDIALDGYEATLTRIRQMAPYGVNTPQEMKSAPWLEGTLFIDMTTKRIVWAEESEGRYLPRLINALIELTWPGWTAIWSPEGTRGTLRATGADTDIIYTDHSSKTSATSTPHRIWPHGPYPTKPTHSPAQQKTTKQSLGETTSTSKT